MVRRTYLLAILFGLVSLVPATARADSPTGTGSGASAVEVVRAERQDISPPLRSIAPAVRDVTAQREVPLRPTSQILAGGTSGALQTAPGPAVASTAGLNFAGVGNGDYGFTPNAAPPDTNGAAGATQYVQWVNESFAVFDKTSGALLYGPAAGNTLWSGFGGYCQTNNDGDPIAQYDKAANRWVMTQFAVPSGGPYYQCLAISTTSDATGSYYRYALQMPNFPDYPKLGVWPDAYYLSWNMFRGGRTFIGARACALNRNQMLSGGAATAVCFQLGNSFGSLLPGDLDGAIAPPAGSPDYYLNFGSNSLNLWKFHVDFVNTANSAFKGPTNLPVAAFSKACGGGACIPQPGTSNQLDSLGDRLMYRLAYRNFGDHEALVVDHSVAAGSSTGVRWYEIRSPGGAPAVYQQGTFAPDSTARWMGSIAMDHVGDIALGYSASSTSTYPSLRYAGRVPGDPAGTLGAENTVYSGAGSQTGNLHRWGDYSSMSVDPLDDCTFWYTNEYLTTSGSFNWSTRIASFKFPGCDAPTLASAAAATPNPVTGTISNLSVLGADDTGESGLTYTWSATGPAAVGFSAKGTNAAKNTTATFSRAGSYTLTATITDPSNLSVISSSAVMVNQTFTSIAVSPASGTTAIGGTAQFTAVALDQFGQALPSQPTFSWAVSGGGSINASGLFTAGTVAGGPYSVTASSGAVSGTASVTVTDAAPTVATAAAASPNQVTGTTTSLSVLGADDTGESSLAYTWSATGPAAVAFSVNGTNAAKNSVATFSQAGSYTFTATMTDTGGLSTTSSVSVTVTQTLTSIAVSPASATVDEGGAQRQFTAGAADQFGAAMTATFAWSVDSAAGTIDANGLLTSGNSPGGPFTVTASSGTVMGTASVTVTLIQTYQSPWYLLDATGNVSTVNETMTWDGDTNYSSRLPTGSIVFQVNSTTQPNDANPGDTCSQDLTTGYWSCAHPIQGTDLQWNSVLGWSLHYAFQLQVEYPGSATFTIGYGGDSNFASSTGQAVNT